MNDRETHIIQKVFLEINTNSVRHGYHLKDNMSEFLQEKVMPYIETYLAGIEDRLGGHSLQLEKIAIDMDLEDPFRSHEAILDAVTTQLEEQIKPLMENQQIYDVSGNKNKLRGKDEIVREISGDAFVPRNVRELQSVIYFIRHGKRPWWLTSDQAMNELLKPELLKSLIRSDVRSFSRYFMQEVQEISFRKRLIRQFPDEILSYMLQHVFADVSGTVNQKEIPTQKIRVLSGTSRVNFWRIVLQLLLSAKQSTVVSEAVWVSVIKELSVKGLITGKPNAAQNKQVFKYLEEITTWEIPLQIKKRIQNAGPGQDFINEENNIAHNEQSEHMSLQTPEKESVKDVEIVKHKDSKPQDQHADAPEEKQKPQDQHADVFEEKQKPQDQKKAENPAAIEGKKVESSKEKVQKSSDKKDVNSNVDSETLKDTREVTPAKTKTAEELIPPVEQVADSRKPSQEHSDEVVSPQPQEHKLGEESDELLSEKIHAEDAAWEDTVQQQPAIYESAILENAGLILLHPFLSHFLKNAGLMDEQNNITDPLLAVHALHFVATGKEQDWEHTMLFEKFICGISQEQSIVREVSIPEKIKIETTNLLNAVLQNWEVLQNSSHDLLRHEFLQRPAKLIVEDMSPRIVFERKTQDLLLNKLPWNISLVKLPWHESLIYVEW